MTITRTAMRALCVAATVTATLVAAATTGQGAAAQVPAAVENFTLIMLPDTQYASQSWPQVYRAQMQWVDDQQAARNIKYVLHVGDVVDDSDQQYQWNNSKSAMGLPTDDVPYIIGPGNHDLDSTSTRAATRYNSNYPRSTFTALPSFGATYPATANDNTYHVFTAGGANWLVLALKYQPSDTEIAWANQVVSAHPNHNVILVTHAYQNGTAKDSTGNRLWTNLVSKHANFRFTFSGHYVNAGVITQQGIGGNTVHQIQADYQNLILRDPNSYLRVMTFNPTNKTVDVKTYSPYLNRYMTDVKNQFVLTNVNLVPVG
ncbi:metallophosphoesterase [Actinoplanes sp. NPDC049118]|uniref:metallophosphoesterase n=1 Tax=Actinoplanes sp. NPDC049118 TaxID=3155769 RepID=UPI0033C13B8D